MTDPAIRILQELAREDLQLCWHHLEDGRNDLALHHLGAAAEKIEQIKREAARGADPTTLTTRQLPQLNAIDIGS